MRLQVDAIGGTRFDDGAGGDNEVQRTMLEIVNQLDGFDSRGNIKARRTAHSHRPSLNRLNGTLARVSPSNPSPTEATVTHAHMPLLSSSYALLFHDGLFGLYVGLFCRARIAGVIVRC